MPGAKLTKVLSGIEDQLKAMLDRKGRMQAYLNRNVYKQYQNARRTQWATQGASEGDRWENNPPKYADYKTRKFAAYPGGGRKVLIATGRLMQSVIGPGEDHRKVATNEYIAINWTTPYAVAVGEARPYADLGRETMDEIYDGLAKFLMEGIMRDIG
jgi:hypothetical protein